MKRAGRITRTGDVVGAKFLVQRGIFGVGEDVSRQPSVKDESGEWNGSA